VGDEPGQFNNDVDNGDYDGAELCAMVGSGGSRKTRRVTLMSSLWLSLAVQVCLCEHVILKHEELKITV
jgi:hypothetical protein